MLHDIAPLTFSNVFAIKTPKDTDLVFIFKNGQPLLYRQCDQLVVPTYAVIQPQFPHSLHRATYLCSVGDTDGFLIADSEEIETENNLVLEDLPAFSLESIRFFRTIVPSWHGHMGVTANHLHMWYKTNRFCGACGSKMEPSTKERSMVCPDCGFTDYPKICPAVIVAVKNGNRLLLTKYANRAFTRYALIAGFCEIGETVEQTVHREVMEEVGLKLKNLTYYKSQPWGFSESLLFGFYADLDGDSAITLDQEELEVGQWFEREDIPADTENALSLTYTMMQAFKNGEIQ
ncbi:NAD(+) diphosphatase [Bengtsoniella intestinalis]|uniref:NAD(+) diphosphatase n=1 Tax=Bengtsoniella intestinalis TaxID=3073143 RepID=UPI00391F1499